MLELPVFTIVSVRVCLVPIGTLPKLRLAGLDPRIPAETAVPVRPIVKAGFEASDAITIVPLAPPFVVGAKVTVRVVLCAASRVIGVVIPLS